MDILQQSPLNCGSGAGHVEIEDSGTNSPVGNFHMVLQGSIEVDSKGKKLPASVGLADPIVRNLFAMHGIAREVALLVLHIGSDVGTQRHHIKLAQVVSKEASARPELISTSRWIRESIVPTKHVLFVLAHS